MKFYPDLHLDRHFRDFNLSPFGEPTLKAGSGPSQSDLFKMAYLIRNGHHGEKSEFASVMECTLRKEAFEGFQALHGPYAIGYAEWFYAKIDQFFGILLYEKLLVWGMGKNGEQGEPKTNRPWEEGNGILDGHPALVDSRQLPAAFLPNDPEQIDWFRIVHELAAIQTNWTEALQRYLRRRTELVQRKSQQTKQTRSGSHRAHAIDLPTEQDNGGGRRERSRTRNVRKRDSIILEGLEERVDRLEICQRLDDKGVPTTDKMRRDGYRRWTDAWANLDLRNNVQQIFSKTLARARSVKS